MNKAIMQAAGFEEEVKQVEAGRCPFCKKTVMLGAFRDKLSLREFRISGLCQSCQDDFFGKEEEE